MPATELIDQLIRDGEVVCYYDFRGRTLRDLAGVGGPATFFEHTPGVTVVRNGRGYSSPLSSGACLVLPDSAAWQDANDGSLVFVGRFKRNNSGYYFKHALGDIGLSFRSTSFGFFNTTTLRTRVVSGINKAIGIDYYSAGSTPPGLYLDGVFDGLFSDVANVLINPGNFELAGYGGASGGTGTRNIFEVFLAVNRRLTADEHRQVYCELTDEG